MFVQNLVLGIIFAFIGACVLGFLGSLAAPFLGGVLGVVGFIGGFIFGVNALDWS